MMKRETLLGNINIENTGMTLDEFNQYCQTFTAATYVEQWHHSQVWKVGGKVFAIGTLIQGQEPAYTFKASDLNFAFLRDCLGYRPAPYFANRGMKWIQQTDTSGSLDEDLKFYLTESYRLVTLGLSQRTRQTLGIGVYPS